MRRLAPVWIMIALVAPAGSAPAQPADTTGSGIFHTVCAACHGPEGLGKIGPDLHAVVSPEEVETIVREGHDEMPSFAARFSDREIRDVARYVFASFGTSGDLQNGGRLFRLNCAACHTLGIRGGALVFADRNAPDLSRKIAADIPAAVRTGPGPMPKFNVQVLSDYDVASITLYVLYMQSPPHPGGFGLSYLGPTPEGLIAIVLGLGALVAACLWLERGRHG